MVHRLSSRGYMAHCSTLLSLSCYITLILTLVHPSFGAKARHFKWDVEYMFWSPDCVENVVMGINGQFPGPTIWARAGDTIHIELTNKLYTEGVVIHWHGIRQFGTPWADGTASISQCAINPGETFLYRFRVERAGTYFYHGHYGMQRSAGLYGSLIVDVAERDAEPFQYDGEFNLLLSDWWHQSAHRQEIALTSIPFRWINEPQSILINGRGQYNCSLAARFGDSSEAAQCYFRGDEQCAPEILHVLPNKTYRLRLASSTALSALNLAIEGHKMLVVEADGNYVQPFATDDLDIYSGESYSVLVTTNQDPTRNYWVSVGVRGRRPKTPPALAVLSYRPTTASKLPPSPPPITPRWDDYARSLAFSKKVLSLAGTPKPPRKCNRRIILLNTQNKVDGFVKWAMSNVSLTLPPTPYLGAIRYGLKNAFDRRIPPDDYPPEYDINGPPPNPNSTVSDMVHTLKFNTTIDVVLQNANTLVRNVSEIHPWHLHGHDFWVLGYGDGKFTAEDVGKFNLENPPFKNTVVLYPYGWTALRFVAANPGVWSFHCHIEPHLHMGMGLVFAEGLDLISSVPVEALTCGLTAKMFLNGTGQNYSTITADKRLA